MSEKPIHTGLTNTKYNKPAVNKYLISRQRLHDKLDSSLERKLTMVVAPAGYGKTTAVLDWLNKRQHQSAWLSVDSDDNNPVTFWNYFFAALDNIVPGVAQDVKYMLKSQDMLNSNIYLSILIDRIVKIGKDILFILDDVHLITNPVIQKGLFYLISYLPSNMHVIFTGRFEPELGFEKIRFKIQIQSITEDDLRFREEEIIQFYQERGFIIKEDIVKKIESFTEGWTAALVAVAMSMENNKDRNNSLLLLGSSVYSINQYLEEEVISTWTEEKRSFAIKTSVLDVLCPPLCDAVTGENNGSRLLSEINQKNYFLTILDSEQLKFRYHQLFKDFLQKLLIKLYPHTFSEELHERAALWYKTVGAFNLAIEHYLSAKRYKEAFELIEQQLDEVGSRNDFDTAFSWINRLPEDLRDKSFAVSAIHVLYYIEMNQLEPAKEWIAKLERMANDTCLIDNPQQKGYRETICNLLKAYLFIRVGNTEEFISSIKRAVLANKDGYYKKTTYMDINASDIYFYRNPCNKLINIFALNHGQYYETMAAYWTTLSIIPGYYTLAVGEYYYEKNEIKGALTHLLNAVEYARDANCAGALVPAMVGIARIKIVEGDISGAFEVLEEFKKRLIDNSPHWHYSINAFIARMHLDAGNIKEVDEWFNSCRFDIYTEISRTREFELIVYARVLMLKGQYSDAELLLKRLLAFTEKLDRQHSRVEVLNLLAVLNYQKHDLPAASEHLEKSLLIGMQEGYMRSYVDDSSLIYKLLLDYARHLRKKRGPGESDELAAYVKSLTGQMQKKRGDSGTGTFLSAGGIEVILTDKENIVLGLLLKAYTNKEISQQLGITLQTVKTHLGNIYSKMGVRNRSQCIKLAQEARLLEHADKDD